VTTDIIVGFPGETEEDFNETIDLIQKVGFNGLFAFKYSDRPNAPAGGFTGKIREAVKKDRLQKVLDLQEGITRRKNEALVGTSPLILVEGKSKRQAGNTRSEWTGRTSQNTIVNFTAEKEAYPVEPNFTGMLLPVKIERALSHSLRGRPVAPHPVSSELKGEKSNAA
jgi:tRNA-2-methylthio-N6-dimethylallyladenosine synthase